MSTQQANPHTPQHSENNECCGNAANTTHHHANGTHTKMNGTPLSPKKKSGKKRDQVLVFNPRTEAGFTFFLLVESIGIPYFFYANQDYQAIVELLLCVIVTASGVYLTKDIFKLFARTYGSPKNSGKKELNIRKFADQGWQLIIHLVFTGMEIWILKDETWWQIPSSCWPASGINYNLPPLVKRLYILQLGARFWSSYSHRFLEVHHKDYFIMFTHHLVTIALTGGTYMIRIYGIGVLVLFVHNASDIIVDVLKMSNHLGWDSKKYFYCTEILFVTNLTTWAVSRLWIFPFYLVYSALWENEAECGDFKFQCNSMRVMLLALVCMHVWWFYLFLKMGYRLVTTGNAHAAAREEYEGESDDESANQAVKTD